MTSKRDTVCFVLALAPYVRVDKDAVFSVGLHIMNVP